WAGLMLLASTASEPFRQARVPGPVRYNVASQGRESWAWRREYLFDRSALGNPALGKTDLGPQLGIEGADHPAHPCPVSPCRRRLSEDCPGVVERTAHRLNRHVELGIDRKRVIILMKLHQDRGGCGPDPRGCATPVPARSAQPVRPFDPFRKPVEG